MLSLTKGVIYRFWNDREEKIDLRTDATADPKEITLQFQEKKTITQYNSLPPFP